jgi:hypothetical protein
MIAGRFVPLAYQGTAIKARDHETAQTVLLVDVRNLDPRLAGVFHPALQSIFAIVEDQGRTLAAAEFVHAKTLADTFGGESCHPKRAAEIISELADGLAELHARNITHGNISTSTALLTAKGKAKLVLTAAVSGATEQADLRSLKNLMVEIGGRLTPDSIGAQSVVTFAAFLRN